MKHRILTRAGASLVAAVSLSVTVSAPADAAVSNPGTALAFAVETNALMQALAEKDAALFNASHPNITCDTPQAVGAPVTLGTRVGPVIVLGTDVAEAAGQCVSATGERFVVTVRLLIEWYEESTGRWNGTPCSDSASRSAVQGVGVEYVSPLLCEPGAAAAGKPHHVHAWVTTDRFSDAYEGFSPVYQG